MVPTSMLVARSVADEQRVGVACRRTAGRGRIRDEDVVPFDVQEGILDKA